jgi:hypothetical protein
MWEGRSLQSRSEKVLSALTLTRNHSRHRFVDWTSHRVLLRLEQQLLPVKQYYWKYHPRRRAAAETLQLLVCKSCLGQSYYTEGDALACIKRVREGATLPGG